MDFHTLTRRELQALCKRNKIPANITNVAMAEALKALEIVEGIEELMQPSQSETAQSCIDSLEGSEVTSPYVPPTCGRSTRRRNVMKEELESVTSVTTNRRTTRRTAAKVSHESEVDTMETPALVSQTSRRRVQMVSACQKMDSQLKECVEEEEKKDISMTPAQLGVTSRRRRVEEGTVQKVYSTRRSVRLAEKNVDMLNDEKKTEESELDNNKLLDISENQKVNLKEDMLNDEKIEESEHVNNKLLAKDSENQEVNLKKDDKQSVIIGVDVITNMGNYENIEKSEAVSAEELDITHEEKSCIRVAEEAQLEEQMEISNDMELPAGVDPVEPVNVSDEVKQSEGPVDEIDNTVQNSEELDIRIDMTDDCAEHVLLASKDKTEVDDDAKLCDDEVEQELEDDKEIGPEDVQDFNAALVKLTELTLQQEDAEVADDIEKVDLAIREQLKSSEPDELEALGVEESEKADDEEQASEAAEKLCGAEEVPLEMEEQIPTSQVVQPNKYSAAAILSDNKENIGSGTELNIMKEGIKPAKKESLNELSLRKLTKMFKEKLEITKQSSNEGLPRAALQIKN